MIFPYILIFFFRVVAKLKDRTPSDYPKQWSGFAETIGKGRRQMPPNITIVHLNQEISQLFFLTRLGDGGGTWRGPHSLAEGCDRTFKVLSYFNEDYDSAQSNIASSCYHLNCDMSLVS